MTFQQLGVSLLGVVGCQNVDPEVVDALVEVSAFEVELLRGKVVDPDAHELSVRPHLGNQVLVHLYYLQVHAIARRNFNFRIR